MPALAAGWVPSVLAQVPIPGQPPLPPTEPADAPLVLPELVYSDLAPILILVGGALLLLLYRSLTRARPPAGAYAGFTVATGLAALFSSVWLFNDVRDQGGRFGFADAVAIDGFAAFFFIVIAAAVIIGALVADHYLRREDLDGVEFYVLSLLSATGGMLMAAANDLILIFLGLETLTIALFVLAGFHRRRAESGEAAIKYFVLSAFSSAFFLYGVALVYGATGATNLTSIATFLADNVLTANGVLLAGLGLLVVGFGFKVAAVPFHTWTPDVYQGAPSPATAFMAGASKAAGFAALLRVFYTTFGILRLDWIPLFWILSLLSLVVGGVLAVVQTDIKRMLAYSSITHAGYILIGLHAANILGLTGALFYVFAYTFMVMGSFAIVTLVGRRGDADHSIESYRGLYQNRPVLAVAFAVLLMAQTGVPFTSGFWAKFNVIAAAVDSESYAIAIVAMLVAVVTAFFYLRIILLMFSPPADAAESSEHGAVAGNTASAARIRIPTGAGLAIAVTVAVTLVVGVVPSTLLDVARDALPIF